MRWRCDASARLRTQSNCVCVSVPSLAGVCVRSIVGAAGTLAHILTAQSLLVGSLDVGCSARRAKAASGTNYRNNSFLCAHAHTQAVIYVLLCLRASSWPACRRNAAKRTLMSYRLSSHTRRGDIVSHRTSRTHTHTQHNPAIYSSHRRMSHVSFRRSAPLPLLYRIRLSRWMYACVYAAAAVCVRARE